MADIQRSAPPAIKREPSALDALDQLLGNYEIKSPPAQASASRPAQQNAASTRPTNRLAARTASAREFFHLRSRGNTPSQSVQPSRNPSPHSPASPYSPESPSSSNPSDIKPIDSSARNKTWAAGTGHAAHRRRSRSIEALRQHEDEPHLLRSHTPRNAAAGVGTKSRRMSTTLPIGFLVNFCPLEEEFKPAHRLPIPGRKSKRIGEGGFAYVDLMRRKGGSSDELYAVKQFRKESWDTADDYAMKVKSEYTIASSCHHPNIIDCIRLCKTKDRWSSVMEFCECGDLFTLIQANVMGYDDKTCLFKQLLRGVEFLHSHGIAHRDLKPENLMLTKVGSLKIIDFGLSEVFSGTHPGLRESGGQCGKNMGETRLSAPAQPGSQPYRSPEVEKADEEFDPSALDIWSCGIVFMTMVWKRHPWVKPSPGDMQYDQYIAAWKSWLEKHPGEVVTPESNTWPECGKMFKALNSPTTEKLLMRMMHPDPSKRISATEALASEALQRVVCCQPLDYDDSRAKHVQHSNIKHVHCLPQEKHHQNRVSRLLGHHKESPI